MLRYSITVPINLLLQNRDTMYALLAYKCVQNKTKPNTIAQTSVEVKRFIFKIESKSSKPFSILSFEMNYESRRNNET